MAKQLKLKSEKLRNFALFENFEIVFDGRITRLKGKNGSGKTTVGLTGIWAGWKGIGENNSGGKLIGERFRFIGPKKPSADAIITIIDEATDPPVEIVVKNHIVSANNQITFTVSDPTYPVNENWLQNLLAVAFMSAKHFCAQSAKEQALLLGINTAGFDMNMKALKEGFTELNAVLKSIGEIVEVEEVGVIDVNILLDKKQAIRDDLNKQYQENKKHNSELRKVYQAKVEEERQKIINLNKEQAEVSVIYNQAMDSLSQLTKLGYKGKEVIQWIDKAINSKRKAQIIAEPEVEEPKYIDEMPDDSELKEIDQRIADASTINQGATKYLEYLDKKRKRDEQQDLIEENKQKQADLLKKRIEYIKSFKFSLEGLSVDETGGLLLDGKPVRDPYFSQGEREIIVATLHAQVNPELKVRFIDDFDLLDSENQEKIEKMLLEAGFQIITSEVGTKKTKENTILLRECKIVESYPEEEVKE